MDDATGAAATLGATSAPTAPAPATVTAAASTVASAPPATDPEAAAARLAFVGDVALNYSIADTLEDLAAGKAPTRTDDRGAPRLVVPESSYLPSNPPKAKK